MRTANGIHGTSRARKGTSTPGNRSAIRRTSSVTASAAVSRTSESVSPANDQSLGNGPSVNQVSCAKTVGIRSALRTDHAGEHPGEDRQQRDLGGGDGLVCRGGVGGHWWLLGSSFWVLREGTAGGVRSHRGSAAHPLRETRSHGAGRLRGGPVSPRRRPGSA